MTDAQALEAETIMMDQQARIVALENELERCRTKTRGGITPLAVSARTVCAPDATAGGWPSASCPAWRSASSQGPYASRNIRPCDRCSTTRNPPRRLQRRSHRCCRSRESCSIGKSGSTRPAIPESSARSRICWPSSKGGYTNEQGIGSHESRQKNSTLARRCRAAPPSAAGVAGQTTGICATGDRRINFMARTAQPPAIRWRNTHRTTESLRARPRSEVDGPLPPSSR